MTNGTGESIVSTGSTGFAFWTGAAAAGGAAWREMAGQFRRSWPIWPQPPHLRCFRGGGARRGEVRTGDDMVVEKMAFEVNGRMGHPGAIWRENTTALWLLQS